MGVEVPLYTSRHREPALIAAYTLCPMFTDILDKDRG
jgi:hypothetical protein